MKAFRSPTKTPTTTKTTFSEGTSISQTDLSKINDLYSENISHRKRKTPDCDFQHQFAEFKNEIMKEIVGTLQESCKNQNQNIKTISENISSINETLQNMKITTEQLIAENKSLKTQITNLSDTVKENEEKITSLQTDFQQLKSISTTPATHVQATPETIYEDLYEEFQDRAERSKNIIIVGVPEKHISNIEERRETERNEAANILSTIYPDCPKAAKVLRVGKYDGKKVRPLKLSFTSQEIAKTIMRNKSNLKVEGVRIYSDQTPQQQNFIKKLRDELQQRKDNGERDLIIKFLKGTPKIVKEQPKN